MTSDNSMSLGWGDDAKGKASLDPTVSIGGESMKVTSKIRVPIFNQYFTELYLHNTSTKPSKVERDKSEKGRSMGHREDAVQVNRGAVRGMCGSCR